GPEIAASMKQKLHFNTFGGNPISVTSGLATLEVIDEERIQDRARDVGAYFKNKLLALQERHALIGEVRGLGLLLAVELVKDRQTREPATAETKRVVELARQRGLLVAKSGCYWNTIRLAPPMCITKPDVDFLVDCLGACLAEVAGT
ncbi:MAG TPA: aminotransferase class III-fold pyridoxal phosphate-dependent enzyme, partial [Phycisphaerae bacterium]|nr:aminotransferase class III-fold pyridoxal phosphate-dependent enzyme [Phycisphaerae bacterium]